MGKQMQTDQGKDHASDKVSLPARHQPTRLPETKQSTDPSANNSVIEMHDRQTSKKRRVGSPECLDLSFRTGPKFDFWPDKGDVLRVIRYPGPEDKTSPYSTPLRRFSESVA